MQLWEYQILKVKPGGFLGGKVDNNALSADLNQLGRQGWEVTTAIDTNYGNGGSREINIILKRPKQ